MLTLCREQSSVPSSPATLPQLADDIVKIICALSITPPIHALIGVSQGGATTLAFSLVHSTLAKKYVVCDTQAVSPPANSKAWDERIALAREKGMTALAEVTVPRWFPSRSEFRADGRRSAFIHDMIMGTPVEGFVVGARALQGYDLSLGLAESLKGKEILFIAGERDGALPGVLKELSAKLAGEGVAASIEIIEGCGHLPMVDGTKEWLDVVEKFLS